MKLQIIRYFNNDMVVFEKSNRKNKKYKASVITGDGKRIVSHFGDKRYKHFFDKIGIYENLNHNDKNRRDKYLTRAKNIKNKKGGLTANIKYSPNWFAINFLW